MSRSAAAGPVATFDVGSRTGAGHREGDIMFIGTATVLMHLGPFCFLTDPNFLHAGQRAPLGYGLHSKRRTDPALELDDLPPLDFVVLSHHHGDHFDPEVAERLPKGTLIVTEPGSARKLGRQGFRRVVALETWQSTVFSSGPARLRVTAVPGRHAPAPLRWVLPEVMGSVLEYAIDGTPAYRIYVTGDTLFFDGLHEIARAFPDLDLCILHLGGTRIAGVLLTMDGSDGVRAVQLLEPRAVLPVHYDDYPVFRSPLRDFLDAADRAGVAARILHLQRGQRWELSLPSEKGMQR